MARLDSSAAGGTATARRSFKIRVLLMMLTMVGWVGSASAAGGGLTAQEGAASTGRSTENVIMVIIDGLRFQEVTEEYMPFTMGGIDPDTGLPVPDPLKPQGAFYTEMYNTVLTGTTPGHETWITGVRQLQRNNGSYETRQRSKEPTMFEYYRKQLGVPMEKVWIVAGKQGNLRYLDYSLNPAYGFEYRSSIYRTENNYHPKDQAIYNIVIDRMNEYHPSLMFINLKDVDTYGHLGVWEDYIAAIKKADKLVYQMWQHLQNDDYYRDNTTFILTTDHGRHSDGHSTGFVDHGCSCRGCRHLIFLTIGPGIKADVEIDVRRDQIDMVPTIGAMLGFQAPYAEGEVMQEMFTDPGFGRDVVTGGARRPRIAVGTDAVHLVWCQKHLEEWNICYSSSTDQGTTWSDPIILFETTDESCYYEAEIAAAGDKITVVAVGYYLTDFCGPTWAWRTSIIEKPGSDQPWGPPQNLVSGWLHYHAPQVAVSGDDALVTLEACGDKLWSLYRAVPGGSWYSTRVDDFLDSNKNIVSHAMARDQQGSSYVAWPEIFAIYNQEPTELQKKWNLYLTSYDIDSGAWGGVSLATENVDEEVVYRDPASQLANDGLLRTIWGRYTDDDEKPGTWEIVGRMTEDGGQSWLSDEAEVLSENGVNCWEPDLCLIGAPGAPALAVWQALRNGANEIEATLDCGASDLIEISDWDGADSVNPDVASYAGQTFVTWQDRESGNWAIKCRSLDLHVLGDADGNYLVNLDDIFAILGAWGECDDCPEDINDDGMVDIDDIFAVLNAWGPCP